VHGDQVVGADELIQLDVVHVPGFACLRRVQDDEDVVGVHVHLGNLVALGAISDRHGVEMEGVGQHVFGRVVPFADVQPNEPGAGTEQAGEILERAQRRAGRGDQPDLHVSPSNRGRDRDYHGNTIATVGSREGRTHGALRI